MRTWITTVTLLLLAWLPTSVKAEPAVNLTILYDVSGSTLFADGFGTSAQTEFAPKVHERMERQFDDLIRQLPSLAREFRLTVIPWGDGVMKPLVSQVPVTPGLKVPIRPYTRDELGKRSGEGTRLGATLTQVAEAGYACHVIVVLTDEYPNDISLLNRALEAVLKTNAVGIFLLSKMYHGKEHNGFSFSVLKDVRPESDKYALRYWHTTTILQVLPQFIEALPGCQFIS